MRSDSNYSFSYVPGAVTVTDDPVYVAVSGTQTYGGATPRSGPTTRASSATRGVATTGPTCTTTATSASTVAGSPYQTSCSGAVDPNYTITLVKGSLAVTKAPLTITASSGSLTYGGTVPTITPSYAGF